MKPASPSSPSSALRGVRSWLAFAVGYLVAYFLSTAMPTRLLWYYPLQHRFRWEVHPSDLAMDFYGRVLLCLASGAVMVFLFDMLRRWMPMLSRRAVVHGLLVWAIGLLLFTAGLYIALLSHRVPLPAALPEGYVPR